MKINYFDIRNEGFRVQQIHDNPLMPTFDHITSGIIAGRAGELYARTQIKPKYISFDLHVEGDVEAKAEQFKKYFLDTRGRIIERIVQFDYSDRYILARLNGVLPIQRHPNHGIISVELIQLDPFSYAQSTVMVEGTTFPVTFTGVEGMWDIAPYITFQFSAGTSDFILTNNDSGKIIRLLHTFEVGQTVSIDMEEQHIFLLGQSIIGSLDLTSRFFTIKATSNSITSNTAGTLKIYYGPKFI